MARKICKNNRYLAKLVTGERALCAFCLREVDDEVIYGKLYAIGDIQCHYFCCLLSCCLIQKGSDEEGLFGFMYTDILAEIERCKKHKCSYCGHSGANLGCSVAACRKQFHVPCGRGKNAVSLYYGSYKSFCQQHAPKQKIPEHIMAKARLRMRADRSKGKHISALNKKQESEGEGSEEMLCLICYEPVEGFPTVTTFWPPCCGKDAWFHRPCLQRMALSAGMHYLKCPLCNDKESFYDAVVEQGYYVPDRDAAWELEQNAFAEIYERAVACSAEPCLCPLGRSHDAENGEWDIKLCLLCGSAGEHAQCILQSQPFKTDNLDQSENITETTEKLTIDNVSRNDDLSIEHSKSSPGEPKLSDQQKSSVEPKRSGEPISPQDEPIASRDEPNTPDKLFTSLRFVCKSCLPAAPQDLNALASSIEAIIQEEQAASASEARRPVMPSRMSIRRTKRRPLINRPSTSRSSIRVEANNESSASPTTASSRLELNLKPPRRAPTVDSGRSCHLESKLMSPIKLLEHSFKEKMVCTGVRDVVLDEIVVATLRRKFRKPRPLCERKRIIDNMLDRIFDDLMKNPKQKEQVKEWCSPKKCISEDSKVELKYKPIDVLKEIEEFQNKENNSNTFNTPLKDLLNIKVEDNGSDLFNNNDNIVNNAVKYEISNDVKISDLYQNGDKTELAHKENKTEPHTLSNDDENMQGNTEIEDITSKNNERCGVTRHSMTLFRSNNDNDEVKNNYSNETEELIIKTRKSEEIDRTSIPEVMVTKSSENEAEIDMSETDTVKEESKNTENIISGNKNKFAKKSIILKFNYSKGRKSLRGVEKSKHTHNYYKNKIRSKSESSTDITILKRLLTEKELCSQLLRELTTGNTEKNATKDSSRSETQNNYEHQKNSNEIPKSVNDRSNFLHDALQQGNHSDRLNEPQKSDECTKSPIKITKRSRKVNNMETTTISPRITRHSTENSNSLNSSKLLKQIPKYPNKTEDINKSAKDSSPNPRLSNENSKTEETAKNFQSQILIESPTKLNDTSKLIDIPKHKTIDILQDSSLEISENDQHINIDVIKIEDSPTTENSYKNLKIKLPDQSKTCLKFSPTEEILEKTDIGIDLERFKKEYLNEVDREFECNFRHKHVVENFERRRYRSPIDFALNAVMKKADDATTRHQKRKISESGIELPLNNTSSKRRKFSESDLRLSHNYDKNIPDNSKDNKITVENDGNTKKSVNKTQRKKIKEKRRKKRNKRKSCREKNIEVTIDSSENGNNKKKKIKTKIAIQNKNFKIKWKKKQLRLNIESKKEANEQKKIKDNHSKFKQYILQFSEGTSKDVLVKPEKEICPLKRMYVKKEKTPDKLKQMSIQSFFKIKSEK